MSDKKTNKLVWGIIAAAVMIILSITGFVLALNGVFKVNGFLLGFMILSAGIGLVFFVYGLVVKGGYETATGYILVVVGLTLLFVALKLVWYAIVFIDFGLLLLGLIVLFLLKSKSLIVERTNEKAGYKSFNEQKAEEAAKEEETKKAGETAKEEEVKKAAPAPEFKHPSSDVLNKKD